MNQQKTNSYEHIDELQMNQVKNKETSITNKQLYSLCK